MREKKHIFQSAFSVVAFNPEKIVESTLEANIFPGSQPPCRWVKICARNDFMQFSDINAISHTRKIQKHKYF
jgi:hypothetical protein